MSQKCNCQQNDELVAIADRLAKVLSMANDLRLNEYIKTRATEALTEYNKYRNKE